MDLEEAQEHESGSGLSALDTKLALARRAISQLKNQLDNLERLLSSEAEIGDFEPVVSRHGDEEVYGSSIATRDIDGVFDGEHMIGEDGRKYLVPPNYASKSKLVEGDLLRLTIAENGKFIFKQKGPIERQRLVGALVQDDVTGDWKVMANGQKFRVLTAAVTFHHGEAGDDAVILVPKNAPSRWAAVENIVKSGGENW